MGRQDDLHNSNLHQIRQLFPDAQFIHVVRDGRDVSLSIRNESFGAKNACETADDWNRALESIQAFSRDLPRDQYFEVRYEDLTAQTLDALGALGDFLGIDDHAGTLRDYVTSHVGEDIKCGNSGKWCQTLDATRGRAIRRRRGGHARALRVPPRLPGSGPTRVNPRTEILEISGTHRPVVDAQILERQLLQAEGPRAKRRASRHLGARDDRSDEHGRDNSHVMRNVWLTTCSV